MRLHGWLLPISAYIAIAHAWPELPHFELEQAGNVNAAAAQQPIQDTCKHIAMLTNLSDIAANQTRLDALLADKKVSREQADYITTKKDTINAELRELNSNTTLAAECGTVNAHREAVEDCKQLDKLEKLVEMANNKTAFDEHLAGELLNQKQMEQLRKNMENAEIKLQKLHGNSTLVELCTDEIGLRQNGAAGQQDGDIGEAAGDNSGAISLSTSDAMVLRSEMWASTCALAFGSFIALVLL